MRGLPLAAAHSLRIVRGEEQAAALTIERSQVFLLSVIIDNALFLRLLQDMRVLLVIAHAADIKDTVVSLAPDLSGGSQKEVYALFLHDPGDKEEMNLAV